MKQIQANPGVLILALMAFLVGDILAAPVGTAFTYQGRLKSAGQPANGTYDLRFTLYDAASGSGQVGSPVTIAPVAVTNGNFTVSLDFGAVFNGDARWLDIGVRTNTSSSPYSTPSARQPLTPTPYALYAPSAGSAATATTAGSANTLAGNLSGDVTGTQTATVVARVGGQTATDVAAGAVMATAATNANTPDRIIRRDASGNFSAGAITAGSFTGSGVGLANLNASQLASGTLPSDRLSGTYTGALTFNNAGNTLAGNGSALTALNASNLASGTVASARLSGTYSNPVTFNNGASSFTGNGAGLTNLSAGSLASGTVPSARLSGTYSGAVIFNNAGSSFTGNGGGLTNLSAGSLASGTVPGARLSGTYSSAVVFNNAGNSFSGNGSGLTSAGLVQTTLLNVNYSGSNSYSTTFTKVGADIGTFTKLLANSTIEVTFNGRIYVSAMSFGSSGAVFELRVDGAATSNGRARASYRYSETATGAGVQTSITGIFTGLGASTHTVSMWVQAVGAGASGTGAQLDPGGWSTDHVVVKELK